MVLPLDSIDDLHKGGFHLIALKVIFVGQKSPILTLALMEKCHYVNTMYNFGISLNHSKGHFSRSERSDFALFQPYYHTPVSSTEVLPNIRWGDRNAVPKHGGFGITLKVIFQGQKVLF